ncbi:acyltransferase domain-containing protein [Streptomyces luomodiensis]|uniref:Acyltransferase domain-containing protein n=1 Tax=Streptomyces luomodiensis TaxID=3026192 RepID=A0ABY9UPV9_9ACTN|nr:polyketide synthase [Streptomyces sp. SCA4-21]WNE94027.1 acyltransferase domain-containing protein [Streptomyces sp. SCA4-21]
MGSESAESLRGWLISRVAELSGVDPEVIDGHEVFTRYGLDSRGLTSLAEELSGLLGRAVPPPLVWRYPSPFALADHLAGAAEPAVEPAAEPLLAWEGGGQEPVAVIGLACRFPKAPSAEAFWRLLSGEADAVGDLPDGRWSGRARGGFLDQVDLFDPEFFDISPREAVHMDPQQRLALELAWEALEDAGIAPGSLAGSRTGVFAGAMWSEYGAGICADPELITQHTLAGGDPSVIPARISYALGLRGPSLQVNTACSSSLVAVHLAARSLRDGECDLALACGVSLMLAGDTMTALTRLGALAPDGRTKAFDARADGYGRGEGAGTVVLKPLSRALADGDPVHCVIRGSAVNNDGATNGLTAPSPQAQEAVLREACARAGVAPADIQYVEAHGTGTALGDPIEAGALSAVLCDGRPADRPLVIGSVKSSIGHLEPAAGIAGLIKVIMAMRHRALPPSAQFDEPNPHIPFEDWGLRVPRRLEAWSPDSEGRLLAGVSAFGFGGTNCHVVLEGSGEDPMHLARLSAESAEALRDAARRLASAADPWSAARALAADPASGPHRLALSFRDRSDLTRGVDSFLAGREAPGVAAGQCDGDRPRIAFLFGGQGSQWAGMGARLMRQEPAFRAAFTRCEAAMSPYLDWSPSRLLTSQDTQWTTSTELAQPAIFAVQVALAELWRHWGVEPDAVAGMSMGEVAAAHVAGALGLQEAAMVMCHRSRLAHQLTGRGGMAVVELPEAETGELVREHEGRLWTAGTAGPSSTVVSGDRDVLRGVLDRLTSRGVRCGLINVSYASHSPYVEEILPDLRQALAGLRPGPCHTPFYSSVTGGRMDGAALDAEHWVRTEREPWRFTDAVRSLLADGYRVFVDADPHPILTDAVQQHGARALPSLRRDDRGRSTLIDSLGALHALGAPWRPRAAGCELLVVSGRTRQALLASAAAMAGHLDARPDDELHDICHTAGARRTHHEYRLAVTATTTQEAAGALRAAAAAAGAGGAEEPRKADPAGGVVFVFPGQGSEWAGVGRTLLRDEPVFRAAVEECDQALRPLTGWSLTGELNAPVEASRLGRTAVAQPVLFAVEVALARLWQSWGITPAAVIGHSVGEIAAAHLAGVLPLPEAARIVHHRARLMEGASGTGRMAAVDRPAGQMRPLLAGYAGRLDIAAVNDPGSVVLSGQADALADALERLRSEGAHCRELRVNHAFHSHQMEAAADELERTLDPVNAHPAALPFYSTVTGALVTGEDLDAGHWARNIRRPVRFADAVDAAISGGSRIFLEVGGHPVLMENVHNCLAAREVRGASVGSLRRGEAERAALLRAAGALHTRGAPIDFEGLLGPGRAVPLPPYPWQRERYWLTASSAGSGHPLLGEGLSSSVTPGTHFWQRELNPVRLPAIAHLRLRGKTVAPGAVFVEMALAAAAEAYRTEDVELADIVFEQALFVDEADAPTVQTVLGEGIVQISGRTQEGWVRHARAVVRTGSGPAADEPQAPPGPQCLRQERDGAEHYRRLAAAGQEMGAGLKNVRRLRLGPGEVLADVRLPEEEQRRADHFHLHPALLDACLQVAVVLRAETSGGAHLVTGIGRLRVVRPPLGAVRVHGRVCGDGVEVSLLDEHDRILVRVEGVRTRPLPGGPDRLDECLFTLAWQRQDAHSRPLEGAGAPAAGGPWLVLAEEDDGIGAALAGELRAQGARCTLVTPRQAGRDDPGALRSVLEDTVPAGVVHIWNSGTSGALALVDAVVGLGWRDTPQIWWVTRAAQAAGEGRHPVRVDQAPLWGVGRAAALSHPDLGCARIDLAADPGAGEAAALAAELLHEDRETDIALRPEGRYVARLVPAGRLADREVVLPGTGTYLVVTDDAELAEALTGWLTEHGARDVAVSAPAGDDEVAALVADCATARMPLRGVICADARSAWQLHQHTLGCELELFVLYSSTAALLGHGGDAPGDALLDAVAHHRRALGLPGVSVNWAPAGADGIGIGQVTRAEGSRALSRALGSGLGQLAVMRLNLRHWFESCPSATGTPVLEGLEHSGDESGSFSERLAAAGAGQRPALLEEHLVEQLALTLGQDAARLDRSVPFRSMGLESLMAVELRNRLESTLGVRLPVALLFTCSTVAALRDHVWDALGLATSPARTDGVAERVSAADRDVAGPDWSGLEEEIDRMSDAEAERLLLESIRLADEESPHE